MHQTIYNFQHIYSYENPVLISVCPPAVTVTGPRGVQNSFSRINIRTVLQDNQHTPQYVLGMAHKTVGFVHVQVQGIDIF